jgi:class 3 adenylate cyclase
VNTAARIQASVCQPDQIVISGNTLMRLTTRIPSKPLGPIALRGRAAPIELFEI